MISPKRILSIKICLVVLLLPSLSFAQFKSAEVAINGLTCSACSRSVEMSIRKLDFVKDVQMDLGNTVGKIIFKEGVGVSINKIAKAVTDAGFSTRYLNATFQFDSVTVSNDYCFDYENSNYQFINVDKKTLSGTVVLKFIGKEYEPPKEYKKIKNTINPMCTKGNGKQKTYYVTL